MNGKLIKTMGVDNTMRYWGACRACGQVDEMPAARTTTWVLDPLCCDCEQERYERTQCDMLAPHEGYLDNYQDLRGMIDDVMGKVGTR